MPDDKREAHSHKRTLLVSYGCGRCGGSWPCAEARDAHMELTSLLLSRKENAMAERRFPLLGTDASIPWAVAEAAYQGYSRRNRGTQTLERMAERGGLHETELDEFIPSWRYWSLAIDSGIAAAHKRIESLEAQISGLRTRLQRAAKKWRSIGYQQGTQFAVNECAAEAEHIAEGLAARAEPVQREGD